MSIDFIFFFQAEDGIRDRNVTGVQTCALPIWSRVASKWAWAPTRARYTFSSRSTSSKIGCVARARPLGTHRRDCSQLRHGLLSDAELCDVHPLRHMPAKT